MYLLVIMSLALRCVPHPPNFAPVMAACLLLSSYYKCNIYSLMGFLFLSDICQELAFRYNISPYPGIHSGMLWIYAAYLVSVRLSYAATVIRPFAASLCFYIISNGLVWIGSGMYTHDISGINKCYVAALPFFKYSLLSDVCYYYSFIALMWVANVYANISHEAQLNYIRND